MSGRDVAPRSVVSSAVCFARARAGVAGGAPRALPKPLAPVPEASEDVGLAGSGLGRLREGVGGRLPKRFTVVAGQIGLETRGTRASKQVDFHGTQLDPMRWVACG